MVDGELNWEKISFVVVDGVWVNGSCVKNMRVSWKRNWRRFDVNTDFH